MNILSFLFRMLGPGLVMSVLVLPVFSQNAIPVANAPSGSPGTTLDFYLLQARQNSPLLKDYQNQVLSGGIDSQLVRAGYRPQVTGSSVNIYAPTINGYGYDNAISNGGNFTTVVAVNQTLVGRRHLDAQYETIRLQNEKITNTSSISEQDLKKNVTAQYI
ncbi:MAG TPA: hypothetical protein VNU72_04980, partial [Puia sp.]|nr:hypothetical protein [Puia sp.]